MRARRTDQRHAAVLDAIRALGFPCMSLHAHGKGLEDILVGVRKPIGLVMDLKTGIERLEHAKRWVLVEVKTILTESTGRVKFTPAQKEWYAQTEGFPRLIVTGPQDAVDKLRRLTG